MNSIILCFLEHLNTFLSGFDFDANFLIFTFPFFV